MYERKKHCYYICWLPADFCVLRVFLGGGRRLLFFWSPVIHGFFSPVPSWPCVWIWEIRELFSICSLCGGSSFAQDSPSLRPLSQSSISRIPFHLWRALVWKIRYMEILFIGEGEIIPPFPTAPSCDIWWLYETVWKWPAWFFWLTKNEK